jgi:glyoxylase-like metal-dependent hydrolase (beta-lactamase superfamily II)
MDVLNMTKSVTLIAIFVLLAGGTAMAQDAAVIVTNAQRALGGVSSVTYSGSSKYVDFQQCGKNISVTRCQGIHDPMIPLAGYVRVIDLEAPASRRAGLTVDVDPGGSSPVTLGRFFQQVTPQQADVSQPWARSLEFYVTPWGFLKGAAENGAKVSSHERTGGRDLTVLSWSPEVKAQSGASYVINGYLNDQDLVVRVETWLGENIMGDMHIVASYSDWRDWGGFHAPTRIVETRAGWPFFQVDVTAATANPPDLASIAPAPANRQGGPVGGGAGRSRPALEVTAEKLGKGLYRLTGGQFSYDSLIVEFSDYIMMLEAGGSQERALAYVAETKRLIPGKPIRYVMNSHPHSDHTAGLPVLVAEGATIITQANNREFLERALNTPRTLLDDALSRNPRPASIETVDEMKSYTDGTRTFDMFHIWPTPHSNGLLVAYIPNEKILFQADFDLPQPGGPTVFFRSLVPALEKLGIVDFDRYIGVHATAEPVTGEDFWKAAGR